MVEDAVLETEELRQTAKHFGMVWTAGTLQPPRLEGRAMDLGLNAIFIESHTLQAEVRQQQQHGQVVDHRQHQKCRQDHLNLGSG